MEYHKTSIRMYHVPEKETKQEGEGEMMCRGPLLSRVQPQSRIKFTHRTIICSHWFLFVKCKGLQLQTKEYDWTRK